MNSQERIMAIVEVLAEAGRNGLRNKELVEKLQVSASKLCRDLALLGKRGWVEQLPTGGFRLSPLFGNFSNLIVQSFREARLRLTEDEARYQNAMK